VSGSSKALWKLKVHGAPSWSSASPFAPCVRPGDHRRHRPFNRSLIANIELDGRRVRAELRKGFLIALHPPCTDRHGGPSLAKSNCDRAPDSAVAAGH